MGFSPVIGLSINYKGKREKGSGSSSLQKAGVSVEKRGEESGQTGPAGISSPPGGSKRGKKNKTSPWPKVGPGGPAFKKGGIEHGAEKMETKHGPLERRSD